MSFGWFVGLTVRGCLIVLFIGDALIVCFGGCFDLLFYLLLWFAVSGLFVFGVLLDWLGLWMNFGCFDVVC